MSPALDELYFNWLYDQVCSPEADDPRDTFTKVLRFLFEQEFVWFVPNDDNRIGDGLDLRAEFLSVEKITLNPPDRRWMELECSMLELFIGLSRRFGFTSARDPVDCFWELMYNVGLIDFSDDEPEDKDKWTDISDRIVWRTYDSNGNGGLFPLENPDRDQRKVELWYQLNAYVLEQEGL